MFIPAQIQLEAKDLLRRNLRAWFPRCRSDLGFHQSFGRDWTPLPESTRFVVYQSRLIWVAASAAEAIPELRHELLESVRHGIKGLGEILLDPENGGHHWMVDLNGKPLGKTPPVKLAYGLAFALYGLSAAARVLGEESAHQQASSAFEFLERLHDDAYGGYFESCEADGTPLSVTRPKAEGRVFGPSGGTSRKSQNTQLHILEALLEYQKLAPSPAVNERIRELTDLMKGAMFAEPGVHRTRFEADWTPIDSRWEIGHDLEAAFLLLAADPDDEARTVAGSLLKFNIGHGFDQVRGGFFDSGPRPGEVGERVKVWWVQAEALNAITYGLAHLPDFREALLTVLELQWHWFRRHQWDEEFEGFFARLDPDGNVRGGGEKAEPWKACYHDMRALINLAQVRE